MIKDDILKNYRTGLKKIGIKNADDNLETPSNPNFGDYAGTAPLKYAKLLKINPYSLAIKLKDSIPMTDQVKIEVIKPGFINFIISPFYLINQAKMIAENKIKLLPYYLGGNKKIIVEFAHPNTHKLFHIGHLRNISTGEAIVRLFETSGNKVIRANYQGDVGLHIAKCLWSLNKEIQKRGGWFFSKMTLDKKMSLIGHHYTEGTRAYEEDEKAKKEIIIMNKMIYEQSPEIIDLLKETKKWSLDYFDQVYKRVNSHFDRLFFESEFSKRGLEIVDNALKQGILEKSQGAVVFNGKRYDLDTRVFVNSIGLPTYEGKELALAEKEFSEFGEIDKCIHVVTPEQTSFFKITFKVEELLNEKKFKNKQYHLIYEWVKLKTGKMSSREGNVVEANWLIDQIKQKILKQYKCDDKTAEILALAAVKYSFLKNSTQNIIFFDLEESISIEGNSAPYLIYTFVRCQSVLKKVKNYKISDVIVDNKTKINNEELKLLRIFSQFNEVVNEATVNFSPNFIANYLYNLASRFNLFYQKCPIIKTEEKNMQLRLLITQTTAQIIKNGLYLLGIETVDKM